MTPIRPRWRQNPPYLGDESRKTAYRFPLRSPDKHNGAQSIGWGGDTTPKKPEETEVVSPCRHTADYVRPP